MAKKRTGGRAAPEAWIGRQVLLGVGTGNTRVSGELREVNDRGVVVKYGPEDERQSFHVLYPWQYVRAIQVPDEEQPE